nr:putative reverse transcriptase domain-containing protein [Tanacetum cinerariifolium]
NDDDQDAQADQDDDDDDDDQTDSDNDNDEFVHPKFSTHDEEDKDEESFDPIIQTPSQVENSDDEYNDDDNHGMNVQGDEGPDAEDDDNELYGELNINLEGRDIQMEDVHTTQVIKDTHVTLTLLNPDGQQHSSSVSSQFVSNMLNPRPDIGIDSIFELTPWVDVSVTTTVEPLLLYALALPPPSIPIMSQVQQTPAPSPATLPSLSLLDLLNFSSLFGFDHRLKTLEVNFSEFMQTNQFAEAISTIPGIVDKYLDHRMNEAVKVAVQLQSNRLRDEAQAENEDFLNRFDENIQKIIKERVKKQVKVQVSKILPKIEKSVNEQLEAEVLTRVSNSSKTSYVVATDLSELELKKILIEKMESNKSIHKSDEQKNLYKGLVDAYECDKIILDTYKDMVTLKTRRDNEDKDKEPSAGSNRGESAPAEEPMHITQDLEEPAHQEFETDTLNLELLDGLTYELVKGSCKSLVELKIFLKEVYKETTDQLDWNNPEGQQYPRELLKPLPLILNSRGHRVIPFDHFINKDLEYLRGGASSQKYTTSVTNTKAADYGHIKWIEDLVPRTMESARDVYFKRRIIAVTELQMVEWHNYKNLDWITVRRDEEKLYKFKEGLFKNVYEKHRHPTACGRSSIRLMRINELHKFNDGTLNDVRTALDDRLKEIQINYLPQTIWRRSDKDRAAKMIQAIDRKLKTKRIMRSLENSVGSTCIVRREEVWFISNVQELLGMDFHQLRVHEEGIPKTAFKTWYVHVESMVMPFGLTNAPAIFMHRVCKPYLDKFVIVFINDILINSNSKEDHKIQEVHFFEHVVNNSGIHVDPINREAVNNWKVPKTPSEIRPFLGLAGGGGAVSAEWWCGGCGGHDGGDEVRRDSSGGVRRRVIRDWPEAASENTRDSGWLESNNVIHTCKTCLHLKSEDEQKLYHMWNSLNDEFNNLYKESGVARHLTVAGTPQQNGLAERMNRMLLNKVRCLLIQSGLPDSLWAEATVMAAYLINRIFGYVAYSYMNQGKLKPRAIKCIFLGYPDGMKGDRLWRLDDVKPKIIISRDVVFNEILMYKDALKGAGDADFRKEVEFKVELQGLARKIPGMKFVRDRGSRTLKVSQSGYVQIFLNNYRMDNGKSVYVPLGAHFKVSLKDCLSKPDITYAVSIVSRYLANPGKNHWEEVKWILKYLKGTADVGLVYDRDQGKHIDVGDFVDADYAKDPNKEAEYMELTKAVKESIWLKDLLIELGLNLRSVVVNCDNQSAIHLSRNAMFHERTKHINVSPTYYPRSDQDVNK